MLERIERAAIRHDGNVYSVPRPGRHHNVIWEMVGLGGFSARDMHDQGFVTSAGRYVDREDGLRLALAAKQITLKHGNPRELYSEDLW